ncbi:MAG: heavy metal response regulator transcription factor [Candidatus Didemnitutus sp.]|nr:heavy metal response regulator transcription factor [Candidatus Didemnitutus sp.]
MRALIVEDEPKAAAFLQRGLEENGFSTTHASRGDEGLTLAQTEAFDIIILDVGLPVLNGFGLLAALRETGREVPVLCLTARDSVGDRVKGLELGADDYLVKPFSFAELLARVRKLVRRRSTTVVTRLTVADLELDLPRMRATRDGQRLDLSPKEFQLLSLLAQRQGEVVSRSTIANEVWDMNFESDTNVVEVAIRRLRKKIDDDFPSKLLHTVRGVGYVIDPHRP